MGSRVDEDDFGWRRDARLGKRGLNSMAFTEIKVV